MTGRKGLLSWTLHRKRPAMGLVLGANSCRYVLFGCEGKIFREPSILWRRRGNKEILLDGDSVGDAAEDTRICRNPAAFARVRPFNESVLAGEYDLTCMLRHFRKRVVQDCAGVKPTQLVVTGREDLLRRLRPFIGLAARKAGFRECMTVGEHVCIAASAGGERSCPLLIVDVGHEGTRIIGRIEPESERVFQTWVEAGGADMMQEVVRHFRRSHGLAVGEGTAARLLSGLPHLAFQHQRVKGKDLATGRPRAQEIGRQDIAVVLQPCLEEIAVACRLVLAEMGLESMAGGRVLLAGAAAAAAGLKALLEATVRTSVELDPHPGETSTRGLALLGGSLLDGDSKSVFRIEPCAKDPGTDRDVKIGLLVGLMLLVLIVLFHWAANRPQQQDDLTNVPQVQQLDVPALPPSDDEPLPAAGPVVLVHRGSAQEKYLDQMRCYQLQVGAVTVEMALYLGWLPEDKEGMAESAETAVERLACLRDEIARLRSPLCCSEITVGLLNSINMLEEIYSDIAGKEDSEIRAAILEFEDLYSEYEAGWERFEKTPHLPDDMRPEPGIEDEGDTETYQRALALMKGGHYSDARSRLARLAERYPEDGVILLKLSDCLAKSAFTEEHRGVDSRDPEEMAVEVLERIVGRGAYSPVLAEAFLKWRTLTQSNSCGVSNYSEIPNRTYNEKRFALLRAVQDHLDKNPNDAWADHQKQGLLDLPNITRGGMTGNSCLTTWGAIYGLDKLAGRLEKMDEE